MKVNEKQLEVIRICRKYIPNFYVNKKFDIIELILSKSGFVEDVLGFTQFAQENKLSREDIVQTIMHDIIGMIKDDEHFLPRVNGYSNLTKA
jgi:hypothetical protein